ncbi:MAG: DUF2079 domain-containing protein [Candidatus Omnitrophica bacterium]|nr:DUF2079 domain-containing protein [Candidatus Omnitrophota bacterium]
MSRKDKKNQVKVKSTPPIASGILFMNGRAIDLGLCAALLLALIYFVSVFNICAFRYDTFQYHDWDFAIFVNGMWGIIHGDLFVAMFDKHFLANHFNIIAFFIAPVYFVFRHPLTLLFLQSFFLAASAIPVYLLARRKFRWNIAVFFPAFYLLYPPLYYVNAYEFHFESFAPFFLTWAFYWLIAKRGILCVLAALLAILCKENIPAVVAAMGAYAVLFRPHRRLLGAVLLLVGLGSFLLITLYLQPLFTADKTGYAGLYQDYGQGFGNIYLYIMTHPFKIAGDILSDPLKRKYLSDIFSPLGFLPLLRPDILIITVPTFLRNLLSKVPTTYEIYWHYTATLTPFLIVGLVYALKKVTDKFYEVKKKLIFVLGALLILEAMSAVNFYKTRTYFVDYHPFKTKVDAVKAEAVGLIPPKAGIIATFDFLPHLANRKHAYSFYLIGHAGDNRQHPDDVSYALIDFGDYFIADYHGTTPQGLSDTLGHYTMNDAWGLYYAKDDIIVMKKGHVSVDKILTVLNRGDMPELNFQKPRIVLDDALELVGFKDLGLEKKDTIHFVFYWHVRKPLPYMFRMELFFSDGYRDTVLYRRPVAYSYYTPQLGQDKVLREDYWFLLPNNIDYTKAMFTAGFVNMSTNAIAKVEASDKNFLDGYNKLILSSYSNRSR